MRFDSEISLRFWEVERYFVGNSEALWFVFGKD